MPSSSMRSLKTLNAYYGFSTMSRSPRILIRRSISTSSRKYDDYSDAKLRDWIAILRYANNWDFPEVKKLAIRYLERLDMDPIQRIRLYQDNKVPERHLFRLYMEVACRPELLGLEESRTLGMETLVLIHQARERLRAQTSEKNRLLSPIRTDLSHTDVIEIVSATFSISLGEPESNPGNLVPSSSCF